MGGERRREGARVESTSGPNAAPGLARTPEPPYWAVIFAARRNVVPGDGYDETAQQMLVLAARQPGYLGVETAHDGIEHEAGIGITVSYWADEESIAAWKRDADHAFAQYEGRARWYDAYELRVAHVERAHSFVREHQ
jgi:heme-degrading monooxygenase HmoA